MSKTAGFLQGNLEHHLDHLAPFCSLMEWPLIVTDEDIYRLGKLYYPELNLHLVNVLEAPFVITTEFDSILTTLPRPSFDEVFFIAEASLRKRLKTFWIPHGNSDKGNLEALAFEEVALVYGQKMIDELSHKGVQIPILMPIGNFRYLYFKKHQKFYEKLMDEKGLKNSFVLYAPTWKDGEGSGTFEEVFDHLSSIDHLVVKPHPNEQDEVRLIQKKLNARCVWLDHFPPIYPLLSRTSHLIGDFSSIGYDFLHFNRPLFFVNPLNRSDAGCFLHQYGTQLTFKKPILEQIQAPNHISERIAALTIETFGDEQDWNQLLAKVKLLDN